MRKIVSLFVLLWALGAAQASAAFELEAGQRFCISDESLECEGVWEVESVDKSANQVTISEYRLLTIPKDETLALEKWHLSRDNLEISMKIRSIYTLIPPEKPDRYRRDPIHICESELLSFDETIKGRVPEKLQDMTDAARTALRSLNRCFEISVCSKKVGFVRKNYIFRRAYLNGTEMPEGASFMRLLGWLEFTSRALVEVPLIGRFYRKAPKCG